MLTRPERPSPRTRERSARAKPEPRAEPTCQVEPLHNIAAELPPLLGRYWRENGRDNVPIDPDWQQLLNMTVAGVLRVMTVRMNGALVGFCFNIVGPHVWYRSTVHGTTIAVWLDPVYRTGWFPLKMLRKNLEFLREWNVKRALIAEDATTERSLRKVFERLGYHAHETAYARML